MQTVRIIFSKTGRAKYISHLDLNRTMSRVMRRAAIPLWYTEGFNRHPYVTFAAPLSLGYEGERECMDIRLEEDLPMEELVSRLNAAMPEGLTALEAAPAVMKPGELTAARYRLTVACPVRDVQALLDRPSIPVEKRTKKKTMKTIDLRPGMTDVKLSEYEEGARLEVTLPNSSSDTVNPGLLIEALRQQTGREELPFAVRRLALFGKDGALFR